ncbi:MAG: M48 family metallopeptidase [Gammaproteobacteria bacterium]|nr:MAG: M48 family metallopeptidase [Gammaproteobacteria bacterium]
MNFFDAQDRARRSTRRLVLIYIVATILIVIGVTATVAAAFYGLGQERSVPDPALLAGTAILTTLFILGASLYKTSVLSVGGSRVAVDMGGTLVPPDVQEPRRRRLRNVVEEMAIASGVPVPAIYVMEEESGINAFAAGFAPADAAIAVTRGTLELLERDELQGVIAHEFSHILNGDMRLNIRLMGVLFGIMVLGLIGRLVLRGGYHSSAFSSRRNRGTPVIMAIGLGVALLGLIGVFFGRLIKASVSRQREFLADASAVQFTRQPSGIANALKKIGGYTHQSHIKAVDPEEVSHMLFAGGLPRMTALFATHPPLTERIQALDPEFREDDYPQVEAPQRTAAATAQTAADQANVASSLAAGAVPGLSATVADSVGRAQAGHVRFAQRLRRSIPAALYDAAHSPDLAYLLAVALAMHPEQQSTERQLRVIREQLGAERAATVESFYAQLQKIGAAYHLPLLEISFPVLKQRPAPQLEYLLTLVRRIIETDGQVDLREYCYYRILSTHLNQALNPAARPAGNRVSRKAARRAAVNLIRIVADQGNEDAAARQEAFAAGTAIFGQWVGKLESPATTEKTIAMLDRSLDKLSRINSAGRRSLLHAVSETIMHDGRLTSTESELLRVICASLDCPLPPLLAEAGS